MPSSRRALSNKTKLLVTTQCECLQVTMWNLPVPLDVETPRWAITFREDVPADFDIGDVPSPGRCPHLTLTFYPAGTAENTFFATISGNTWPLRHALPQWELSRGEKGGWIRTSTVLDVTTTTALDELRDSITGGYRVSFAAGLAPNIRAAVEAIFHTE